MLSLTRWRPLLNRLLPNSGKSGCQNKRSNGFRPTTELLEDRVVPAVDVILEWNAVMIQADRVDHSGLTAPSQGGPTRSSRAMAIVSTAMYDAYNSIHHNGDPYLTQAPNSNNANSDAAVAKAARDTLVALYPNQQASFDAALTRTLARVPNNVRETRGIAVGAFVAQQILAARANDGSNAPQPYTPGTTPGSHDVDPLHPTQGFLTSKWGDVTPFGIDNTDNIPTRPIPALNSIEYTMAFNQVKALGGDGTITPTQRTAEQTEIGVYWGYDGSPGLGVPPRLYNQIARQIAEDQDNTVAENARLFALLNIAQADAGIQCWGVKYDNNFWRPILGIRGGETDGNPFTPGDSTWKYYGAPRTNPFPGETNFTPPFPAYTSGHATFGSASFKTLANFYHTDDISFTFTSDEFNGVNRDQNGSVRPIRPRSYDSLSYAAAENAASRIFLGIHWRFDATEGVSAGNRIADYVFENTLVPHGRRPDAIANSNFVAQIDSILDGVPQSPPAPPAPPAPLSANLADGNLVQGLNTPGNTEVTSNVQLDRFTQRLLTKLTRANDRLEILADRLQQRAENASGKTLARLQQLEDVLRDKIFANQEVINRLGDLV